MTKIYFFPVKLISSKKENSTGKSDFDKLIDRVAIASARYGRSQGFIIGATFANIVHLIIHYWKTI